MLQKCYLYNGDYFICASMCDIIVRALVWNHNQSQKQY